MNITDVMDITDMIDITHMLDTTDIADRGHANSSQSSIGHPPSRDAHTLPGHMALWESPWKGIRPQAPMQEYW